jgi:uncharacterized protein (TIGR03083 family)
MISKDELLRNMNDGFHEFMTYLDSLSEADFITPTDAAGWTVKDHVMHLAVWEDGMWALLNRQSRHAQMGLDPAAWERGDFDEMNAIIQQQHKNKPLGDVLQSFRDTHRRMIATIESLTDDDLQRPYDHYQPGAGRDAPVIDWIIGDSYEHYAQHRPWIEAIVSG